MTRSEMKFTKAIKMLKEAYDIAQKVSFVKKPMAYALYQVWKYFDENEKPRNKEKQNDRK